jgi:hypothetical protein
MQGPHADPTRCWLPHRRPTGQQHNLRGELAAYEAIATRALRVIAGYFTLVHSSLAITGTRRFLHTHLSTVPPQSAFQPIEI